MSRGAAAALAVIAIVAGVAGALVGTPWNNKKANSAIGPAVATTVPPQDPNLSIVATAIPKSIDVFSAPNGPKKTSLANPNENGAPLTFLERDEQPGWVHVLLPVRPNGSDGWVRASDVRLTSHYYKIVVELAAHRVIVSDHGKVFLDTPAGIGKAETQTPVGLYYTKELLQPPNPNTVYGHYVYGLSGFSNVIFHFEGGDGVIGIHGTNDPSGLGKDVSHGCIRISNDAIDMLAKKLPLGVPVEIRQ
ncbi:MAG TPA: L,D-transpeptidase [Acidimicrobiales bacterium]|nr:L,D-transpeptidase [Acidimicrobiales bacterium]